MKLFKIFAGIAILAVFGVVAYSYYSLLAAQSELNRKRTEAARAARWKETEPKNENENEKEQNT